MNTNDLISEGVEAVGGWLDFIARKRRKLEAQIAEMHDEPVAHDPTPTTVIPMPPGAVSVMRAFPQAPLPTEAAASAIPSVMPPPMEAASVVPSLTPPTVEEVPMVVVPESDPARSDDLTDASAEMEVEEVAGTEAGALVARFEATWRASTPERFPRMVQEAYARREEVPDEFAQLMVSASAQGYLTPALDELVEALVLEDTHFQAAYVLFQDPQFANLFEIAMDDRDYDAEDTLAEGEADRAVARGEDAF